MCRIVLSWNVLSCTFQKYSMAENTNKLSSIEPMRLLQKVTCTVSGLGSRQNRMERAIIFATKRTRPSWPCDWGRGSWSPTGVEQWPLCHLYCSDPCSRPHLSSRCDAPAGSLAGSSDERSVAGASISPPAGCKGWTDHGLLLTIEELCKGGGGALRDQRDLHPSALQGGDGRYSLWG